LAPFCQAVSEEKILLNSSQSETRIALELVKIYMPCNFEVNLITHLGVIALFSSFFSSPGSNVRYCQIKKDNNFKMGNQIYFKIAG
jgi:hypothetical protein